MEGWTDEDELLFIEMKRRRGEASQELTKKRVSATLRDFATRLESGEAADWRVSTELLCYDHIGYTKVPYATQITIVIPNRS